MMVRTRKRKARAYHCERASSEKFTYEHIRCEWIILARARTSQVHDEMSAIAHHNQDIFKGTLEDNKKKPEKRNISYQFKICIWMRARRMRIDKFKVIAFAPPHTIFSHYRKRSSPNNNKLSISHGILTNFKTDCKLYFLSICINGALADVSYHYIFAE